jgi:hypothetical protein
MAWEQIETAPQDGTHILAYGRLLVGGRFVPVMCEIWTSWTETFTYVQVGDNLFRKDIVKSNIRWEPEQRQYTPTHWMPLPRPPVVTP